MKYAELTDKIIRCAFEVHNNLGFGFLEKVYENSLIIEMKKVGLVAEQQKPIKVKYKGCEVGEYLADIVVNDVVIIELKSGQGIAKEHETQLVNYLTATGKDVGLLINFGKSVQVKRKVRDLALMTEEDK